MIVKVPSQDKHGAKAQTKKRWGLEREVDRGKKLHHRLKVLQEAVTKMELDRHRFGGTTLVKNKGGNSDTLQDSEKEGLV